MGTEDTDPLPGAHNCLDPEQVCYTCSGSKVKQPYEITPEDIRKVWIYADSYFADVLNGKYSPAEARQDILSLLFDEDIK